MVAVPALDLAAVAGAVATAILLALERRR